MTSGNFKSIPIDGITVDRATRQRRNLVEVDDLADSIKRVGLINPPVIREDGTLVAGERRLTACKKLGWTSIPVQYIEDLPEHEARLVELEENIRRVDLDWKDQCLALQEYHELRKAHDEEWNATQTSKAVGLAPNSVSRQLSVAKELRAGNERVVQAPKFSVAHGIVSRAANRKQTATIKEVAAVPLTEDEAPPEPVTEDVPPLLNEDFNEWATTYDGPRFNFVHCDFPYGINADKHQQGNAAARGGYDDSPEIYYTLLSTLCDNLDRICTPNAHLMFWLSMEHYTNTIPLLESAGFTVLRRPLIWFRSDNSGILPDARRRPRGVYETALMCARGDRHIVGPVADLFAHPNVKSSHMSEKPRSMLRHFFRMFVDDTTFMLDPTCGSGNAVRVANDMGAEHVLGLEKDKGFYDLAVEGWTEE